MINNLFKLYTLFLLMYLIKEDLMSLYLNTDRYKEQLGSLRQLINNLRIYKYFSKNGIKISLLLIYKIIEILFYNLYFIIFCLSLLLCT